METTNNTIVLTKNMIKVAKELNEIDKIYEKKYYVQQKDIEFYGNLLEETNTLFFTIAKNLK